MAWLFKVYVTDKIWIILVHKHYTLCPKAVNTHKSLCYIMLPSCYHSCYHFSLLIYIQVHVHVTYHMLPSILQKDMYTISYIGNSGKMW